jgi:hypothetical protein
MNEKMEQIEKNAEKFVKEKLTENAISAFTHGIDYLKSLGKTKEEILELFNKLL